MGRLVSLPVGRGRGEEPEPLTLQQLGDLPGVVCAHGCVLSSCPTRVLRPVPRLRGGHTRAAGISRAPEERATSRRSKVASGSAVCVTPASSRATAPCTADQMTEATSRGSSRRRSRRPSPGPPRRPARRRPQWRARLSSSLEAAARSAGLDAAAEHRLVVLRVREGEAAVAAAAGAQPPGRGRRPPAHGCCRPGRRTRGRGRRRSVRTCCRSGCRRPWVRRPPRRPPPARSSPAARPAPAPARRRRRARPRGPGSGSAASIRHAVILPRLAVERRPTVVAQRSTTEVVMDQPLTAPPPRPGGCSPSSASRCCWSASTTRSSTSRCRRMAAELSAPTPANCSGWSTPTPWCSPALLLLGGHLGDRSARRRMLLTGLDVFALTSWPPRRPRPGADSSPAGLAMGVGAALIFPATLALL